MNFILVTSLQIQAENRRAFRLGTHAVHGYTSSSTVFPYVQLYYALSSSPKGVGVVKLAM